MLLLGVCLSSTGYCSEGLVSVKSAYSVNETASRFVNILDKKGLTLFARIDHEKNAESVGHDIPSTEVILFGNPKLGTPLMQCAPAVAIDLPQKALIWQDSSGAVWFSYNDPKYLVERHAIKGCEKVIEKISSALSNLSQVSTRK